MDGATLKGMGTGLWARFLHLLTAVSGLGLWGGVRTS